MKTLLLIIAILLASVNSLIARFALARLRQPTIPAVWMVKVFVSALSPILFIIGVLTAFCGILLNSWLAIIIGSSGALRAIWVSEDRAAGDVRARGVTDRS